MANWKGTTVVSKLAKVLSYSSSAAWQYLTWIQQNQAINAPFQSQLLITQWNGAITWESIAITCCGNESVTEFVVFFLGLYHTQCCTRQFCCGICRRLLPACRRETTCKGACLALARVVATTDVGRGRLWAPPLRRSDPRSLCPMVCDWAGCTFARVCNQLYSECTPRDSQNPPRYWAFPGVIMNNKSQEAVRTRILQGRVCESNETKEGPSRARKIVEWTGWRGFRVSIIARCRDGLQIAATPAAACEPYLPLSILLK
jgi:hypothetical protein